MSTFSEAALWMVEEIKARGELYQEVAVVEVERLFGQTCVVVNNAGNFAFSPLVLREFRKLTDDSVVWDRRERYWRLRRPGDESGRLQT